MKKIFIFSVVVVLFFSLHAQQSYTYLFSSTPFISSPAGGPELETIGTTTTPVLVMIPETTCPDTPMINLTHFEYNAGFKAHAFFTGTYSIEMIFQFDDVVGYNRLIDFSNSNSDYGIYTLYDCLNFYPNGNVGTCPGGFDDTNYYQLVITRNDSTKQMNVYVNGTLFCNHLDDDDYYVIGTAPNDTIKFFRDDKIVQGEASSGNVALIRMADFEISASEVLESFEDFCARIQGVDDMEFHPDVKIYPNPASDVITIEKTNLLNDNESFVSIIDIHGNVLMKNKMEKMTKINMSDFSCGVYFLKLQNKNDVIVKKIIKN